MPAEVNDSLRWLQGVLDEVPILGCGDIKIEDFLGGCVKMMDTRQ